MLQLNAENLEIIRIAKLLVKYNVKATISDKKIQLEGTIPDGLIDKLCAEIKILAFSNFLDDSLESDKEILSCHELNLERQSENESFIDEGYLIRLRDIKTCSRENISNSRYQRIKKEEANFVEQEDIVVPEEDFVIIKKSGKIITSNQLINNKNEIEKSKLIKDVEPTLKGPVEWNEVQQNILSSININELERISSSNENAEDKIEDILELFGFDLKRNGIDYLIDAIHVSLRVEKNFKLDELSSKVAKKKSIKKEEIQRVIVARVKEKFKFDKSPAIDFIRIVNYYVKQEK